MLFRSYLSDAWNENGEKDTEIIKKLKDLKFYLSEIELDNISEEIESKSVIVNNNLMVSKTDLGRTNWIDAKKLCSEFREGGFDDWRLPTKDELNQLFLNQDKIGGFVASGYWSSSEYSSASSWLQNFTSVHQGSKNKYTNYFVRAVRGF